MAITNDARPAERVALYFRRGGSDKVYHVAIEPQAGGGGRFVVTFAYGRRGGPLATGAKTLVPVAYEAAKRLYDKLVKAKTAKGYAPGAAAVPYQRSDRADPATAILPQLLNPVDESDVDRLLADDAWWLQEKYDGRRVLIRRAGGRVTATNRTGVTVALPAPVAAAVLACRASAFLLDGEAVGEAYVAFDLLEAGDVDLRQRPYRERHRPLVDLIAGGDRGEGCGAATGLRCAETATSTADKRALLDRLRDAGREGVVFKRRDAPHAPGRPASGGPQLKLKFCATASCLVAGANRSKRSVRLELVDAGGAGAEGADRRRRRVGVGNVTIPPNHPVPAKGDVVEVRFLYAFRGGSLYQPVYLGRRDDVSADACPTAQLKFKASEDEPGDDHAGAAA